MNCGTVRYDAKHKKWEIACAPHVMIRLKRTFPRIAASSQGKVFLSDTQEVALELDWFLSRFPMAVDRLDYLNQRAAEHREREAMVERLLSNIQPPLDFSMAVEPRHYQKVAASVALSKGSLLLADDVGIGKTCSAICIFTDLRTLPALVVTLAHLPLQWEREISKFLPQLRTHIIKKSQPYDVAAGRGMFGSMPDVLIINYHKLSGWAETLAPLVRSVVFDECQELRHAKNTTGMTQKYSAAKHIASRASFRMGLSATPIYNFGGEFYNVLDILSPGELGDKSEFSAEWCGYSYQDGKEKIKDPQAFGQYLRSSGLMLRRTRKEVGRELPAITKIPQYIEADTAALDTVSETCAELARTILKQGENTRGEKMLASEEFSNRLRQATGIAKAPFVAAFLELLLESEKQVVVYAWHREVYSILLDKLAKFNPVMYTGSESPTQKESSRTQFLSGQSRLLFMSLRAGAGLDGLQAASRTAVFAELDWSPGVHEQCIGRIARDGQTEPVMAYFLIAESGSDPVVADVLGVKAIQIEGVRDPNLKLVTKLQTDPGHVKRLAEAYLLQKAAA